MTVSTVTVSLFQWIVLIESMNKLYFEVKNHKLQIQKVIRQVKHLASHKWMEVTVAVIGLKTQQVCWCFPFLTKSELSRNSSSYLPFQKKIWLNRDACRKLFLGKIKPTRLPSLWSRNSFTIHMSRPMFSAMRFQFITKACRHAVSPKKTT